MISQGSPPPLLRSSAQPPPSAMVWGLGCVNFYGFYMMFHNFTMSARMFFTGETAHSCGQKLYHVRGSILQAAAAMPCGSCPSCKRSRPGNATGSGRERCYHLPAHTCMCFKMGYAVPKKMLCSWAT